MRDLVTMAVMALLFLLPVLFFGGLWLAVRHGPVRSPLWRGERWHGFAAFVTLVSFSAGFFGPMLLAPGANQGPMLGLLVTGPAGLLAGVGWGLARAKGRGRDTG